MGDVEDSELSDFPLLNEAPDFVMVPSVPIEKIHGHQQIARLNLAQQRLLFRNAGGNWFLGNDLLVATQSCTDEMRADVRKGEHSNYVRFDLSDQLVRIVTHDYFVDEFTRPRESARVSITHPANPVVWVGVQSLKISRAHVAEADHAYAAGFAQLHFF